MKIKEKAPASLIHGCNHVLMQGQIYKKIHEYNTVSKLFCHGLSDVFEWFIHNTFCFLEVYLWA